MDTVYWHAELSDGTKAVEHSGSYQLEPGKRKPWVRLTQFLAENDLHLTSLSLVTGDKTVRLPMKEMNRFGFEGKDVKPQGYALQYLFEGEADQATGVFTEQEFVDVITHYNDYEVHYIQSFEGDQSWMFVTEGFSSLAPTPPIKE